MATQYVRILAHLIAIIYGLYVSIGLLDRAMSTPIYWLWVIPSLTIYSINTYFLIRNLKFQPQGIDKSWSGFIVSLGASLSVAFITIAVSSAWPKMFQSEYINRIGFIISSLVFPVLAWAVFCLRDCFTVLPEAHKVVSHGAYRLSRHPLYVCYMIWAVSCFLMFPTVPVLGAVLGHICALLIRLKLEEKVLLAALPGYYDYYRSTGLVWKIIAFR